MPPHPLTNFEIQKYYQNKSKFNSVYLKNYLPKIWTYVINLDEYESIGCHVIALYVNSDNVTYFHGFGVEYIPIEIKMFIGKKNIATNTYRIQANDPTMWGYFCILFIHFI